MKRYVIEFANEFLNNSCTSESDKKEIEKIVGYYKRGMITSIEAVDSILKVHKR